MPYFHQPFLDHLSRLLRRAQDVNFVVPDDTGYFSIENEVVAEVARLLADASPLLREIRVAYEEYEPPADDVAVATGGEDDFLLEIGAAISTELAAREIADLAFVSRTQILESHEALEAARRQENIWAVASHADTGLRRIGKGLLTIEAAIREYAGLEPLERRWSDLDDSLETRRLYGAFRRAIAELETLSPDTPPGDALQSLRERLTGAAGRIAVLRDLKIYPFLRVYDRIPIRRLQKRIAHWLETDSPGEQGDTGDTSHMSPEARLETGRQLWSDLVSFSELLTQINLREELRQHDWQVVDRLNHLIYRSATPPQALLAGHLDELRKIFGLSDELDELLLQEKSKPGSLTPERLREPLEDLRRILRHSAPEEPTLALP